MQETGLLGDIEHFLGRLIRTTAIPATEPEFTRRTQVHDPEIAHAIRDRILERLHGLARAVHQRPRSQMVAGSGYRVFARSCFLRLRMFLGSCQNGWSHSSDFRGKPDTTTPLQSKYGHSDQSLLPA